MGKGQEKERIMRPYQNPIFIVGQGNSGTSLLNNIVERHTEVFAAKETWFFVNRHSFPKLFGNLSDPSGLESFVCYLSTLFSNRRTGWAEDIEMAKNDQNCARHKGCLSFVKNYIDNNNICATHDRIFGLVFSFFAAEIGKRRWVESTPVHLFYYEEIIEAFPDAFFINVVRNPFAVVASGKVRSSKRVDREKWPFEPVLRTFAWKKSICMGARLENRYPKRFHTITYEDLISHPEQTVRSVCSQVGLEFESQMLEIAVVNAADPEYQGKQGFLSDRLERWRTVLSPEEIAIVKLMTSSERNCFNYASPQYHGTGAIRYLSILFRFFAKGPRIVLGKLQNARITSLRDFVVFLRKRG